MACKEEWAAKIMAFVSHDAWMTPPPSGDASVSDRLKMRIIEMKVRRKKHAVNKVVMDNPHLGYDGIPKKQAPLINESMEGPVKSQ